MAMSEQARDSIGGLLGQQEPEPLRILDNRDCREIGNCEWNATDLVSTIPRLLSSPEVYIFAAERIERDSRK